jgi:hypothetical protein
MFPSEDYPELSPTSSYFSDWSAFLPESGSESVGAEGFTTLREQLFPLQLPSADSLSDLQLIPLLNSIEIDLLQRGYQLEFLDRLPARVTYRGLCQQLDAPLEIPRNPLDLVAIDGCDGSCEACFQLAYCPSAREALGKGYFRALEEAGSNPSWTMLYALGSEG